MTEKVKGSALDRGFPTGVVLILLVIIVVILQGISAWKVMNLEKERTLLEKDKNDFEKLGRDLPVRRGERDRLMKDIPKLEGVKNDLVRQVANLESQLAQARETIDRSKEAEKIKINLEKAAIEFKTEIENKTNEIMQLAGPNSLIQKSAGDLKILIDNFGKTPEALNQVVIQANRQINSSLNTVNKATASLQSEVTSFSSTSETANNAVNSIKEVEKKLLQQTEELSKSSNQFSTQIVVFDNNLVNLENYNQQFSNEISEVARIASDINSTADKFKKLYADTQQEFNEYKILLAEIINVFKSDSDSIKNTLEKIKTVETIFNTETNQLSSSSEQLKTEIEGFKTIVTRNQTISKEFSDNTNKIGNTATDLSSVMEKVEKISNEAGTLFTSLQDNAASLESVIGSLTANSSIIKNAGNDLQLLADGLSTNVNKISLKVDIIERDASDFSRKIETFDPSGIEDAIKGYVSQLSKNMEIISSRSDNLSNLNKNVERMFNELQNEIELFNKLLEKQRKSLTEVQETPS